MTYNFCTYFDSNYLWRGITMYTSLLRVTDNFKLWILCFDNATHKLLYKMKLKNVELISLEDFEDEDLRSVKKDRTPVEYFWTCTPSLPLYILRKYPELDLITYIDADLYFFSEPSPIFEEFNDNSILLIEHRYARDIERKIKRNGRYNVQFITFRNDNTGKAALVWWRDRCLEWCYWRVEEGKMGDQKYLDDWGTRFPRVCILKNKGAGLAPWNVMRYETKQVGDEIFIDEDRLIFYHFHFFKMYKNGLFNLSTYKIPNHVKKLIYIPYIRAIGETMRYIKQFDESFRKGYSSLSFNNIKEIRWLVMSLIRGNFIWAPRLLGENR
jgi:hypothetical protein